MTVSPVLNSVTLVVSQMVSADWAPTLKTTEKMKMSARTNAVVYFIISIEMIRGVPVRTPRIDYL
jgi:hypothetical protein